ncbi:MAG: ROK family protein [Deltaproteobacteria bacterium]
MTQSAVYAGVDVGGTFTKAALLGPGGRILAQDRITSRGFSRRPYFAARIQAVLSALSDRARCRLRDIIAAGVGVPGPVDFGRGVVLSLTNIRGWTRYPLARDLSRRLRIPVFVENDANCMVLAESRLGAGRGARHVLGVTLGTGVGGGLMLAGGIYRGPFFLGGEVGHIPISSDGPDCPCGGSGCLERFVGNAALLERARRVFGKRVCLEEISGKARRGNSRCRTFWREVGEEIGRALAGVVNTCGPEVIVVGGGVAAAGGDLLDAIEESVKRHAMKQIKGRIRVRRAALGNDAGMIGAALLAREQAAL